MNGPRTDTIYCTCVDHEQARLAEYRLAARLAFRSFTLKQAQQAPVPREARTMRGGSRRELLCTSSARLGSSSGLQTVLRTRLLSASGCGDVLKIVKPTSEERQACSPRFGLATLNFGCTSGLGDSRIHGRAGCSPGISV